MEYQKTAEASDNLIGDKIADAVAKSYDGKTTKVYHPIIQKKL